MTQHVTQVTQSGPWQMVYTRDTETRQVRIYPTLAGKALDANTGEPIELLKEEA